MLLDEPFASLDTRLRETTGRAVAAALRAAGATAVLVTHDQAEALSLADQVAVMRDGRIAQADAPLRVYRSPVDTGAAFVGGGVVLSAVAHNGGARCALGPVSISSPPGRPAMNVLIRPEQIEIHPDGAGPGVPAEVAGISFFGHDADVRLVLLESGSQILARVPSTAVPEPGARVRLAVRGPVAAYT